MSVAPNPQNPISKMTLNLFKPFSRFFWIFATVYILPFVLYIVVSQIQSSSPESSSGVLKLIFLISSYIIIALYALISILIAALSIGGIAEILVVIILSLVFGISYAVVLNNIQTIFSKTKSSVTEKSRYLKSASGLAILGIATGLIMLLIEIIETYF